MCCAFNKHLINQSQLTSDNSSKNTQRVSMVTQVHSLYSYPFEAYGGHSIINESGSNNTIIIDGIFLIIELYCMFN